MERHYKHRGFFSFLAHFDGKPLAMKFALANGVSCARGPSTASQKEPCTTLHGLPSCTAKQSLHDADSCSTPPALYGAYLAIGQVHEL